ncbi:MAG: NTP transferase domain-containing protein [Vulcanimicrobiaceae bacterium]
MRLQPHVAITAGARVDGDYADLAGTSVKALAAVRGRTMLDRVLDAALEIAPSECVAVVGGGQVRAACDARGVRTIDESASGGENVRRALTAWRRDVPLLYLTSDMPYVTGAAIRGFLASVPPHTVAMPVCDRASFVQRFPGAPPFGVTLAGECVVNGGAFLIPPAARGRVVDLATAFFDARKSPARMAAIAGPAALVRLIFKRLSIAAVERRASHVLENAAIAVRGCAPELAYDADDAAEYRYACSHD